MWAPCRKFEEKRNERGRKTFLIIQLHSDNYCYNVLHPLVSLAVLDLNIYYDHSYTECFSPERLSFISDTINSLPPLLSATVLEYSVLLGETNSHWILSVN